MSILKLKDSQGNWIGVPTIKGDKGDKGNGISSAVLNNDYTLTLTFTDGTTYTTPSIRGEKGEQGEPATDMNIHICSASEYDSETRIPTMANPNDKTFYLVPTEDGTSPDLFTEWVYVNNAWEMFGSASVDLSGYLTDVKVGGNSVVTDGVAEIPIASRLKLGAVKVSPDITESGLFVDPKTGSLSIFGAPESLIKEGENIHAAIAPYQQHTSTFYGLAKVSGIDEKDSELPVGQYTDEAKASIQDMLDVPSNADLDEVEEKVKQNTEDLLKAFPIESASGNITSFEDGANDIPLQSLVVDINPVQDLHGQDAPYPAGGGLNKVPLFESKTVNGVTLTNNNGEITLNGTATADAYFDVDVSILVPNGSTFYLCCFNPVATDSRVSLFAITDNGNPQKNMNVVNGMATTTATADTTISKIRLRAPIGVTLTNFKCSPMLQIGGTAPTVFSPYENICPISGWTEINAYNDPLHGGFIEWNQLVRNAGENYGVASGVGVASVTYNDTTRAATYQNNNTANGRLTCRVPKRFKNAHTYLLSCDITCSIQGEIWSEISLGWVRPFRQNINANVKTHIEGIARIPATASDNLNRLQFFDNGHASSDYTLVVEDLNLFDLTEMFGEGNEPSTVEEFRYYEYNEGEKTTVSAVNGKPYTHVNIQLGQTVYGGKLDVLSGELTVDRVIASVASVMNRNEDANGYYWYSTTTTLGIPNISELNAELISDRFVKRQSISTSSNEGMITFYANNIIRWKEKGDLTLADYRTYLASNPFQLCYELAEPIEIQLSSTEVRSLLGENHIWADTGDTEVEYRADPDLYIQRKMPEVPVDDVQINGTSIVQDGVANVPIAGANGRLGAVTLSAIYGVNANASGTLFSVFANDTLVKGGTESYRSIVPYNQHKSVFYGLAKAASDTTQSKSSNAVGNYTDNAKDKIQTMLGVSPLIAPHESDPFESAHVIGELFIINGKLYRAKTALTAGEYINEGTNVEVVDVAEVLDGKVDDVQINGTSIISDGVANIPYAAYNKAGVVQVNASRGTAMSGSTISTFPVDSATAKAGTQAYQPITPAHQHESVFYGLAKASGDSTQASSDNAVGTYTDNAKSSIQTMLGLDDVVRDTDYATSSTAGVVKADSDWGIGMYDPAWSGGAYGNFLYISPASSAQIKAGSTSYKAIVPNTQHEAVFYGLAKVSGDTTQVSSSNAVGTYTSEAKTAIKQMLDIHDTIDSFVEEVTGTDVTITGQPSYRYNCGELYSLTVTPPSSGTIDFRFTSGSTPTVLTLPQTVKMPEWWVEVEANTIYEMCITDGIYCGVMTWAI